MQVGDTLKIRNNSDPDYKVSHRIEKIEGDNVLTKLVECSTYEKDLGQTIKFKKYDLDNIKNHGGYTYKWISGKFNEHKKRMLGAS
jgi:hypothetical protein